jgi:hypothetical protein
MFGAILRSTLRSLVAAVAIVMVAIALSVGWNFLNGLADAQVTRLEAGALILAAIATVILAVGTFAAVGEAGRQAKIAQDGIDAAREAVAAANREADVSADAVAVATEAERTAERAARLGAIPILHVRRPYLSIVENRLFVSAQVVNLGPGNAFDVALQLERERAPGDYVLTLGGSGWSEWIVGEGDAPTVTIDGADLRNLDAQVDLTPDEDNLPGPLPSNVLIPKRIRVRVSWLSARGGRGEQTMIWETQDIHLEHPATWQPERLELDAGDGYGPAIVIVPKS